MSKPMIPDESAVFYCAFRYALGRKTYMVEIIVDQLIANWERLTPTDRNLIVKEIIGAVLNSEAGMNMDVDYWKRVIEKDTDFSNKEYVKIK